MINEKKEHGSQLIKLKYSKGKLKIKSIDNTVLTYINKLLQTSIAVDEGQDFNGKLADKLNKDLDNIVDIMIDFLHSLMEDIKLNILYDSIQFLDAHFSKKKNRKISQKIFSDMYYSEEQLKKEVSSLLESYKEDLKVFLADLDSYYGELCDKIPKLLLPLYIYSLTKTISSRSKSGKAINKPIDPKRLPLFNLKNNKAKRLDEGIQDIVFMKKILENWNPGPEEAVSLNLFAFNELTNLWDLYILLTKFLDSHDRDYIISMGDSYNFENDVKNFINKNLYVNQVRGICWKYELEFNSEFKAYYEMESQNAEHLQYKESFVESLNELYVKLKESMESELVRICTKKSVQEVHDVHEIPSDIKEKYLIIKLLETMDDPFDILTSDNQDIEEDSEKIELGEYSDVSTSDDQDIEEDLEKLELHYLELHYYLFEKAYEKFYDNKIGKSIISESDDENPPILNIFKERLGIKW